jgi:heme A synthase
MVSSPARPSPAPPRPPGTAGGGEETASAHAPAEELFRFAVATIVFTIAVILWGAVVRATKYGDGCGAHWPYCNGEVFPTAPSRPTMVEFAHRVTSGLSMLMTYAMTVFAFRVTPTAHPARRAAAWASIFMTGEAAIGALLVLSKLVAHEESTKRAVSGGLHLVNTFLLVGALVATAYAARRPEPAVRPELRSLTVLGASILLALGITGAIAALGDTLFPARSLTAGFAQDLSPVAHLFLRLRAAHPFTAVAGFVLMTGLVGALARRGKSLLTGRMALAVRVLFAVQIALGLANLLALAPLWLQIVHLLSANLLWIAYCVFAFSIEREPAT